MVACKGTSLLHVVVITLHVVQRQVKTDLPCRQLLLQLLPLSSSKGAVCAFSNGHCPLQLVNASLKQPLHNTRYYLVGLQSHCWRLSQDSKVP